MVTATATKPWERMSKDERKLLLREEQDNICPACQGELSDNPTMFDLSRTPGHPYSKNDYRDKSICYVRHATCHQAVDHGNIPWFTDLRALIQHREEIQRMRIRLDNRRLAIEREMDDPSLLPGSVNSIGEKLAEIEEALNKDIERLMKKPEPIAAHALEVRGVGPVTLSRILAEIDIHRAEYPSSLHKFAGFAPGFDRMQKGEKVEDRRMRGPKRPYNARLRTACRVQGDSFLKAKSPYREDYDRYRERDEVKNPGLTKLHYHNRGMRYMMKIFLSHLWHRWRTLEGLSTARPYAHERLGHTSYIAPEERGWPEL